jgi:hypothetical protein
VLLLHFIPRHVSNLSGSSSGDSLMQKLQVTEFRSYTSAGMSAYLYDKFQNIYMSNIIKFILKH